MKKRRFLSIFQNSAQKAKFAAITTTSGTGTEVTAFAVIADEKTGVKYPIADYEITPDVAIVDTNLVMGLTQSLVADTGMDAITHSFEAYVSTVANPMTDALAIHSIDMIDKQIVNSYNGCTEARKDLHIAQCMAGMAFTNAILGIVHSMAHKTGKVFGIPHGRANAIYLPYVIQYNAKEAGAKYAKIAKQIGIEGDSEEALVANLVKRIEDLRAQMGMPATIKEAGISEEKILGELNIHFRRRSERSLHRYKSTLNRRADNGKIVQSDILWRKS